MEQNYIYLRNDADVSQSIRNFPDKGDVALDIETTGLDPHTSKIRLIQLAPANQPAYIFDMLYLQDPIFLCKILENADHLFIGSNIKFDLKFLIKNIFPEPENIYDVMLADQLIYAGKAGMKFSLAQITERYLAKKRDKSFQIGGWSSPELSPKQLDYAADDVRDLHLIKRIQLQKLDIENLNRVANLEFQCSVPFAMMELNGVKVSRDRLGELYYKLINRQEELEKYIFQVFEIDPQSEFNLYSPSQLLRLLQRKGFQVNSTNKKELSQLSKEYKVIDAILKCKSIRSTITNHVDKLPKFINPATDRIHTNFFQLHSEYGGAVSGRIASSDPVLLNIPNYKAMRSCFVAEEGNMLCDVDYSQIEIRIIAEVADDQELINVFATKQDVYKTAASIVLKKPVKEITKLERTQMKGIVLGAIYGRQAASVQQAIFSDYNIALDFRTVQDFLNALFKRWKGVKRFHDDTKRQRPNKTRTMYGRIRHLPEFKFTEAVNSPIQGTGADLLKLALVKLHKNLQGKHTKLLLPIHDEILLETPQEHVQEILDIQMQTMKDAGEEILKHVPVEVEGGYASNWWDAKG